MLELQPFFKNIEKRVVKTPKIYFLDSRIRNQVPGSFSLEILEDRGEMGKVLEQEKFFGACPLPSPSPFKECGMLFEHNPAPWLCK